MKVPKEFKYSRTHEWVRVEGDVAVVGITEHAVVELGDLAFVDLPEKGARVAAGERFGEIESTKTVSDLIAPVGGEIIEVNTELVEDLQRITSAPHGEGWMVKIRLTDRAELDALLSAEEYEKVLASEEH